MVSKHGIYKCITTFILTSAHDPAAAYCSSVNPSWGRVETYMDGKNYMGLKTTFFPANGTGTRKRDPRAPLLQLKAWYRVGLLVPIQIQ